MGAIKELARILRIGGRVIITVWALEQKHRRFESQDVLIPWQKPSIAKASNGSDEGAFCRINQSNRQTKKKFKYFILFR